MSIETNRFRDRSNQRARIAPLPPRPHASTSSQPPVQPQPAALQSSPLSIPAPQPVSGLPALSSQSPTQPVVMASASLAPASVAPTEVSAVPQTALPPKPAVPQSVSAPSVVQSSVPIIRQTLPEPVFQAPPKAYPNSSTSTFKASSKAEAPAVSGSPNKQLSPLQPVYKQAATQPHPARLQPQQMQNLKANKPRSQSPAPNLYPAQPASTNVSINISLPKLHRPKLPPLPKLPYKKIAIITGIVVAVAIIGLVARHFIDQSLTRHRESQAAHQAAAATTPTLSKPNFIPVVPQSEASLASVGPKSAYDGTRNTYSYSDTFQGTSLTVSQQPVPASFKSATAAITTVAKSLGAATPVLANNGTGYLATDTKSGSQTVVFALNDVLIFVQSPFKHSAADWASYLGTLK